jgi:hypothetical protein
MRSFKEIRHEMQERREIKKLLSDDNREFF